MSDIPLWTDPEIATFCARIGLTGLEPEGMARLRKNADKVAATGRALPRMARKEDEPANRALFPSDGTMSVRRKAHV
jgi:hypothetical protein